MEIDDAVIALSALAQKSRLEVFRLLIEAGPDGAPAGEIARELGVPANTMSFHLAQLVQAGLVISRREGRFIRYAANFNGTRALFDYLVRDCCQGRPELCGPPVFDIPNAPGRATSHPEQPMTRSPYNVLFLCTGNSARSVMAEALLNHLGGGNFRAWSAGSHPTGRVNPLTIETLRQAHLPVEGLRSKSWDEFAQPGAPKMDFVFTVCDSAAGEICPVWPGQPVTGHWGFEDPAAAQGTEVERMAVFQKVFREIQRRIQLFLALPVERLDRLALKTRIDEIGRSEPEGVR